jgi:DNA-binding response OmpR family regulator
LVQNLAMSNQLLLVEDDQRLAAMLRDYLTQSGYRVEVEARAATVLARLRKTPFELLILDLMLPDGDGLTLCQAIRAQPAHADLGILMLTARGDATDRIIGLELGADDYLPKPFEPRELLARLRAIARRRGSGSAATGQHLLQFGRLEIDRDAREARIDGETRTLTSHQFALLRLLAENAGRVLSRDWLIEALKGTGADSFDRSIDVHVSKLRAALEDAPKRPRRIITVRGAGYVFARAQD